MLRADTRSAPTKKTASLYTTFTILFLLFGFSIPARADITTGLVGWWKLDDGSGVEAVDSSGRGNTGTLINGPTWVAECKRSGCLSFVAASIQYLKFAPIDISTNVSMSIWAYSTNFVQSGLLFQKKPVNTQWQLFFDPTTGVAVHGGGGDLASCNTFGHSPQFPTNNAWHHFVATISGTVCNIYVDGELWEAGTVTAIGNGTTPVTNDILISTYDGTNYPFNGSMDDARIYNRALSPADIRELYVGLKAKISGGAHIGGGHF